MSEISKEVTNWEIFMWSLDQLDGRTDFIETEEVFFEMLLVRAEQICVADTV